MTPDVTTAVILAAGMGTRLRNEVADRPKGFVRIGSRPIVEESVLRLRSRGITDIVIVTGFAASHYEALARGWPGLVRTVHNGEFAESGSMYSLWCARDRVERRPFLLLESDLVYEPRALDVLLDGADPDAVLLSGPTGAGDEVYVESVAGRLVAMAKDRSRLASVAGELVGISRVSAELFGLMQRIAAQAFASSLRYDYETGCLVAAARDRAIACPVVTDLAWGEIDDPAHLRRVTGTVYPVVAALDARGRDSSRQ
jgi:2-aminoethylphosphonate-pyruvate transaminase